MHLLFAEDEVELSRAVVAILEFSKYEVDAVYDGEAALQAALANRYDGIILDIMMPKKNGIEVLEAIRKCGITVPVMMLTAKAEIEDRVEGLDMGANDYLTKPFAMKELLARIRAMIRVNDELCPKSLTVGNITIERSEYTLKSEKASVSLNLKEYHIMELLSHNPYCVVSKKTLLTQVFGEEETDGILELYLSYLENKLKSVHADIKIAANGDGYYLENVK